MSTGRREEDGPCRCGCHDHANTMHIMPCCAYTYVPRREARARALIVRWLKSGIAAARAVAVKRGERERGT